MRKRIEVDFDNPFGPSDHGGDGFGGNVRQPERPAPDSPKPRRAAFLPARDRPLKFSDELERLKAAFAERAVCLREVLDVTFHRGYTVLLILLAFPFCTPLPFPGLSMPFGLMIAFIGLRLSLRQKPWLPTQLLDTQLPATFFPRLLPATHRLMRWLELLLKPRLGALVRWRPMQQSMGAMIFVCGLLMLLPLPLPFSNGLPALTVLLLASAVLEEDGYCALAGSGVFLLTLAFFAAILRGGPEVASFLKNIVGGGFQPAD